MVFATFLWSADAVVSWQFVPRWHPMLNATTITELILAGPWNCP